MDLRKELCTPGGVAGAWAWGGAAVRATGVGRVRAERGWGCGRLALATGLIKGP